MVALPIAATPQQRQLSAIAAALAVPPLVVRARVFALAVGVRGRR